MLPTMSAGIKSGVNWMREYLSCRARAMVRSKVVLPVPTSPVIKFKIQRDGTLAEADVERSSGLSFVDRAALQSEPRARRG